MIALVSPLARFVLLSLWIGNLAPRRTIEFSQILRTEADLGTYVTRFNLTKERGFRQCSGDLAEPMSKQVFSAHLLRAANLNDQDRKNASARCVETCGTYAVLSAFYGESLFEQLHILVCLIRLARLIKLALAIPTFNRTGWRRKQVSRGLTVMMPVRQRARPISERRENLVTNINRL